ncbi:hypothetical protein ACFE04_004923 [Oxalis oulophora]
MTDEASAPPPLHKSVMLSNSDDPAPSEDIDVADSDMSKKFGFKMHVGGELKFRPLDYVGGETWDYAAVPEKMSLPKLNSIVMKNRDLILEDVRSHMLNNSKNDEVGTNEDDVSVDGISFYSDREDDELVSQLTQAANVSQTAAAHGP